MALPDSWMQELLSKSDIATIVGEHVRLVPRGGKLWACCPFHHEKTPSFTVDVNKQLFYCFGCHKGGSVVQFIREIENMPSTIEAIKFLAQRANMDLPNTYDSEELRRERAMRDRLCQASREAARFFYAQLKSSPQAQEYFAKRGLTPEIIKRFGLGYSPDSWDSLYNHLTELGFTREELYKAGLIRISAKTNKPFDFFRNRVMFPIISETGVVIGFGGRTMGSDEPKYLNTGETPIYNKRNNLYALNTCNKQRLADLIIVEGYMDVIAMHSAGITNAVASLGTALTRQQATLIKRRVSTVYISYDGDSAGQNATLRGLDILSDAGLSVRVIVIPDGNDPDEYIKSYGRDAYLALKDNALALNAYKLERMSQGYDLMTPDGRQAYATEACKLISTLQPVEQERYYDVVATKTGLSVNTLRAQGVLTATTVREERERAMPYRENRGRVTYTEREVCEQTLVACALQSHEACMYACATAFEYMRTDKLKSLLSALKEAYMQCDVLDVAVLASDSDFDSSKLSELQAEYEILNPMEMAKDCKTKLQKLCNDDALRELAAELDAKMISSEEYRARYAQIRAELSVM